MSEGIRDIIWQLLQEYGIQHAFDIQNARKPLLSGTIKETMEAETDEHSGYEKYHRPSFDDGHSRYPQ